MILYDFRKDSGQAPVVQNVDSAIRWINLYPVDSAIGFPSTYLLDSDLSSGYHYQRLNNRGHDFFFFCSYQVPQR